MPTPTTTSPERNRKSGRGDGITSAPRRTATIEALVRVRAFVSPSVRLTNGELGGNGSCSVTSPAAWSRSPAS